MALALIVSLGGAGVVVGAVKLDALPDADATLAFWLLAALPLLAGLVGWLRPVPKLWAAQLLDRAHGLRSRLASALEMPFTIGSPKPPPSTENEHLMP